MKYDNLQDASFHALFHSKFPDGYPPPHWRWKRFKRFVARRLRHMGVIW